jgi:hypothetical protein
MARWKTEMEFGMFLKKIFDDPAALGPLDESNDDMRQRHPSNRSARPLLSFQWRKDGFGDRSKSYIFSLFCPAGLVL